MRNKFLLMIAIGVSFTPAVFAAEPRELSKLSEFPSGSYLCSKHNQMKVLPSEGGSESSSPKSGTAVSASESHAAIKH